MIAPGGERIIRVPLSLGSAGIMLGWPARAIGEIAREAGADLIVVGTHGHSAAAGVLLGSVTRRLLHVAPCPVLVIPPPGRS